MKDLKSNSSTPNEGSSLDDTQDAEIWEIYIRESRQYDKTLIEGWYRTLDVTFVFAGLFSAVVTAFIVDSMKQLQPDRAEQTVDLLQGILSALSPNGTQSQSTSNVLTKEYHPKTIAILVNVLSGGALSLSVGTGFWAVIAKEGCYYYLSREYEGHGLKMARERHGRFLGFKKWHIESLMRILPMVLYFSLGMFCFGQLLNFWAYSKFIVALFFLVCLVGSVYITCVTVLCLGDRYFPLQNSLTVLASLILEKYFSWLNSIIRWIAALIYGILYRLLGGKNEHKKIGDLEENPMLRFYENEADGSLQLQAVEWVINNTQDRDSLYKAIKSYPRGGQNRHPDGPTRRRIVAYLLEHLPSTIPHSAVVEPELGLDKWQAAWDCIEQIKFFAGQDTKTCLLEYGKCRSPGKTLMDSIAMAFASLPTRGPPQPNTSRSDTRYYDTVSEWIKSLRECHKNKELEEISLSNDVARRLESWPNLTPSGTGAAGTLGQDGPTALANSR